MTTEELMYRSVKAAPTIDGVQFIETGLWASCVFGVLLVLVVLWVRFRD